MRLYNMVNNIELPDFGGIFEIIEYMLEVFNDFWYFFFKNGNFVLFLIFSIMGIVLLLHAREKEYDEKVHGKVELVKRRGRAGSAICVFIGFGFLLNIITPLLFDIFKKFPEPQIVIKYVDKIETIISLEQVHTLNIYEKSMFFLISFLSFLSMLLIAIGIYLMCYNKFIIRSKLKSFAFIGAGIVFWIFFGFKTSLRLIV